MRESIEQRLREDAAADASFRASLLSDPVAAVEERYGAAVPAGVSIRVIEEGADEVVLVLPTTDATVTEAQLDAVTGAGLGGGGLAGY